MKILITGGSGLLGKSLLETAPEGYTLNLTYNKNWRSGGGVIWYRLDIRSKPDVLELFEIVKPDVVIHCASIGSVDYTESHYAETEAVNIGGLINIIDACNDYRAELVYISSNAVYSGDNPPYNEDSPLEPVNAYGLLKKSAERAVRDTARHWFVIRPFMLYGWPYPGGRTNWAAHIVASLGKGQPLKLVDDIIWMPTYGPDCASAIWELTYKGWNKEIFNIASPDRLTLYQFGLKVCEVFGLDRSLLTPVETSGFAAGEILARRPKDTSYDLVKLDSSGIRLVDIKRGLEMMRETR